MVAIDAYLDHLISALQEEFGPRLVYVGLQGSYLRGEADEKSDIDAMVVLDELTVNDLSAYRGILMRMGNYDLSCGFVCGRAELANWNPLEICHLVHTTRDCYGSLQRLVPPYTREDEKNFILFGLNNLYHALCHGYVHNCMEQNAAGLGAAYKQVFFLLQNIYYLQTGTFPATKRELTGCLEGKDKEILEHSLKFKTTPPDDLDRAFAALFDWCQNAIVQFQSGNGTKIGR